LIAIATLLGVVLDFSGIDPIKALLWSAVINGIVAVPLMFALMHMASRPKVMRSFTIGNSVKYLGWAATLVMAIAAVTLGFMTFFK
jgi:Mn2+/Fe2+ NRAMP family transporter